MFWENIAAVLLILASFPIWIFVSIFWGLIKAVLTFFLAFIAWVSMSPVDWGEVWVIPVGAILQGIASAWSVPATIWTWAKFDHPWWAVIIALVLFAMIGGSRSR